MGKTTGFKEIARALPARRDVDERLADWKEIYVERDPDTARDQGARCMDCGVPFCHQGCPLGNQIPDWNDLVYRDRWREAYVRLSATNNFPEFTGRLCPAPCEAACVLAVNDDAVTIEQIEKEIIERAFAEGWVVPQRPIHRTDHHVAVVGSGPAGLAAAAQLGAAGHRVTVYEAADKVGGLLRYGIPDFKLEKWVIDRRVALMENEGIKFVTNARVGDSPSWGELGQRYDAVVVAIGAGRPRDLEVEGRELRGVHFAMEFLSKQNQVVADDGAMEHPISARNKHVLILGGGDTGSDCLGTALRHGAKSVHQIELLPRPGNTRAEHNPWPQWPMICRTSSSQEEGGTREFAIMTKRLSGTDGRITRLHAVKIDVSRDADGRMQITELADGDITFDCDLLLLAMGFLGPDTTQLVAQLGPELDARGNVKTNDTFATTVDGLFAAGDAQRGQSLIVWAISDGREAARNIDTYLRGGAPPWLPTRGKSAPFGGR